MRDWHKLRVGTNITGVDTFTTAYCDNLRVVGIGADWAVLSVRDTGEIVACVLEPKDAYTIGEHIYTDDGFRLEKTRW